MERTGWCWSWDRLKSVPPLDQHHPVCAANVASRLFLIAHPPLLCCRPVQMLMALRATSGHENFSHLTRVPKADEISAKKRDGRKLILVDHPESKLVWPT